MAVNLSNAGIKAMRHKKLVCEFVTEWQPLAFCKRGIGLGLAEVLHPKAAGDRVRLWARCQLLALPVSEAFTAVNQDQG